MTGRPASTSWTGQHGEPTILLLLRHGQTGLSVQRRYSGRGDPELTDLGHAQAAAAGEHLARLDENVSAVFSSPLRRARDTAARVATALDVPMHLHDGLVETDFGAWEGLTFAQARDRDPELHRRWLGDDRVAPPGGESFAEVGERIAMVRDELVASRPRTALVLVTHVTPIKTLLRIALDGGPAFLYRLHLDLASLSIVDVYPDGAASVRLVNGPTGS